MRSSEGTGAGSDRLPRAFTWLNVAQFLGVVNDNVFRLLVIFVLLDLLGEAHREWIIAIVTVIFVAPFLLFSDAAGVLADRFSKRSIIWWLKVLEAPIMAWGAWSVKSRSVGGMLGSLFAMCAQSAFYSPAKYGIIPELVAPRHLSRANAQLVGATYVAMIVGTFVPSWLLLNLFHRSHMRLAWFCVGMALVGLAATWPIPGTPPSGSRKRPSLWFPLEIVRTLREVTADRELLGSVLGSAYFFYVAAFLQQNGLLYGKDYLGLAWEQAGYIFPLAAVGVVVGAWLAGRMSGPRIEIGLAPLGAFGLVFGCVALAIFPARLGLALGLVFLFGLSSGLFVVPLNAFLQYRSEVRKRGEIIACVNWLSFACMVLAAGTFLLLTDGIHTTPRTAFLIMGGLTAVIFYALFARVPEFLLRLLCLVISRGIYRARVWTAGGAMPLQGGVLLVSSHVSCLDPFLIGFAVPRRVRCVVSRDAARRRWLRPWLSVMAPWVLGAEDSAETVARVVRSVTEALARGEAVCVFPEGAMTRNGHLRRFLEGCEPVLASGTWPVFPVYLARLWGRRGTYGYRRRAEIRVGARQGRVTVMIGEELRLRTLREARQAMLALSADSFDLERSVDRSLPWRFVREARRHWKQPALADTTGRRLTYGRALTGAVLVAQHLRGTRLSGPVGVLLPPSVAGAVANLAASLSGRPVVNLNYTIPEQILLSVVRDAGLTMILTGRAFLERAGLSLTIPGLVFLEDLISRAPPQARWVAWARARFVPIRRLLRGRPPSPDDPAAIVFSSGSTGSPKGVVLTHHNILSNIEQFQQVVPFLREDCMAGILPFFHAFGLTCTLWAPLLSGIQVHYHPNPLDAKGVLSMVRERRLTLFIGPPTFLLAYARQGQREDLTSVRLVIAGAEKLTRGVARAFHERFGKTILEGYGTSETSPVVSVNVPDVEVDGLRQLGSKEGATGVPIPGVCVKIVDLATGEEAPVGAAGEVWVKGANVMLGYWNNPARTAEAIRDGWYATGDVGLLDEDGFLVLVDRLARFSKIGGEMVPHGAVEQAIAEKLGLAEPSVFVVAVPDERKGEQLIAVYLEEAGPVERLQEAVRECRLPNLWKPKPENFVQVTAIPRLPSGKVDWPKLRHIVEATLARRGGPPLSSAENPESRTGS